MPIPLILFLVFLFGGFIVFCVDDLGAALGLWDPWAPPGGTGGEAFRMGCSGGDGAVDDSGGGGSGVGNSSGGDSGVSDGGSFGGGGAGRDWWVLGF